MPWKGAAFVCESWRYFKFHDLVLTAEILSTATGLFGRTVISFKTAAGVPLPATRMSTGDTVALNLAADSGLQELAQGVRYMRCLGVMGCYRAQ